MTAVLRGVAAGVLMMLASCCAAGQPGTIERILRAPDGQAHEEFGASLAILGTTLAVGAPRASGDTTPAAGACYVFDLETGELLHKLQANEQQPMTQFGASVALTPTHVLVGAPETESSDLVAVGRVYVFSRATGEQLGTIEPDTPIRQLRFGHRIAATQQRVVVAARGSEYTFGQVPGEAHVYDADDLARIAILPRFRGRGFGVVVSLNDEHIVVGNGTLAGGGDVHLYDTNGEFIRLYRMPDDLPNGLSFGSNAAVGNGELFVPLRPSRSGFLLSSAGGVRVFSAESLAVTAEMVQPQPTGRSGFGESIAITDRALVVGAYAENTDGPDTGAVYIYTLPDKTYFARIDGVRSPAGGPRLGTVVAAEGDFAVASALADDENGLFSGAVYVIRLPGGR